VKNAPEGRDYVDILLDIVGEYFEQSKPVAGADRSVYDTCLMGVAAADEREEIGAPDIRRLQEAPTILNLMGQPTHPDEVLLQDSEWHAVSSMESLTGRCANLPPSCGRSLRRSGSGGSVRAPKLRLSSLMDKD
jgi:hypothetical protein